MAGLGSWAEEQHPIIRKPISPTCAVSGATPRLQPRRRHWLKKRRKSNVMGWGKYVPGIRRGGTVPMPSRPADARTTSPSTKQPMDSVGRRHWNPQRVDGSCACSNKRRLEDSSSSNAALEYHSGKHRSKPSRLHLVRTLRTSPFQGLRETGHGSPILRRLRFDHRVVGYRSRLRVHLHQVMPPRLRLRLPAQAVVEVGFRRRLHLLVHRLLALVPAEAPRRITGLDAPCRVLATRF